MESKVGLKTFLGLLAAPLSIFAVSIAIAAVNSKAKMQKTIPCDEYKSQSVIVPYGRVTALNFPTNPKEVIPGEAGFDFKTIRSDLVIKALRPGAKTNLLVYLEGRRCSFHLSAAPNGDELLFVRDPKENSFEVKFHD